MSETRIINASAGELFELLADPAQHPRIDGSGSVLAAPAGVSRLALGSKFAMDMKLGAKYRMVNKVVEFEEGRRIAWCHLVGHRWRWELEPIDDSHTKVTETFDFSTAKIPFLLRLTGFPGRNQRGISSTLDNLQAMFP